MAPRHLAFAILSLLLAAVGYLFFAIVVAIYAGLWLHNEKMYYAQGLSAQLFGATGVALGVLFAWLIWQMGRAVLGRHGPS